MRKILFLSIIFCLTLSFNSFGQSQNFWKSNSNITTSDIGNRKSPVKKFLAYDLDFLAMQQNLKLASVRNSLTNSAQTILIQFPLENGKFENFEIEKVDVLHPELGARYPEIGSYYGVSKQNGLNKIFISISPLGITGLITGDKTIYIDPVSETDPNKYIVYDRNDCQRSNNDPFICNAVDEEFNTLPSNIVASTANTTDGKLRTYKLALACTSEYSYYYGNTIPLVLAAMNTTITRVNSVYLRDLAVRFQLVDSNDRLIYINGYNKDASPDIDPYDNYNGSQMLNANTSNINGLITSTAYNIGHVFSTGGGGIASTAPCGGNKGAGVTGIVTPQFDPFDIDYVCHEIGHQFGAGHTYYNACFGSKVNEDYEPGSASTIMGYAGICTPNVQSNSDAYFHAISLQQMTAQIGTHTCEAEASNSNAEPIANAGGNFTIPKSTPFILNGSLSSDANSADVLTYCWEQYNNDGTYTQPPLATNAGGPVFRSFTPTTDPIRTFPNLNAIINNETPTWEVLPSVTRTLNFRLTVRDNNSVVAQTNSADAVITVGASGPFKVTSPNTNVIWYTGETKTVSWDPASTNTAVYSQTVNIKLSTDGGYTYPITLVSGVPNSGNATVTVPDAIGKNNRIKVEAAVNIFFDISNINFEIKSNKYELTTAQPSVSICKPNNAVYTLTYTPAPSFSETVTFSALNLPTGAVATFSPTTRNSAGNVTMTISGTSNVAIGNYSINFKGASTNSNITTPLSLRIFNNEIGSVVPNTPVDGAQNQQTSVLLNWNALSNASSYIVEIATNPTFSTLTETATVTNNFYQTTNLANNTVNYWRVKPINPCITGSYSKTFSFQIAQDTCKNYTNVTYEGNAVWETNSTNAVIAKINITDNIVASKVTFKMKATHAAAADLKIQLSSPTGLFIEVYNRDCSGSNFDVTFDDDGTILSCGTNPALGGTQKANQPLSKFIGSNAQGVWTLLATDRGENTSGGTMTAFSVNVCGKIQIVNNIITQQSNLSVNLGSTKTISSDLLASTQLNATAAQIKYTLVQLPLHGILKKNNIQLNIGDSFTQADIANNLISYTNDGNLFSQDDFKYTISGNTSAYVGGKTFNITICKPPVPTIANLPAVTGSCNVTVTPPTAISDCYGEITATTTTVFPITTTGSTPITWIFNDGNGQTTTAIQNVIINSTTWNGNGWSNNAPTASVGAIFTGNFTATQDLQACSLLVTNNAQVVVNSGIDFNITGKVTIDAGSLVTFQSNSNLLQTEISNNNTGNAIVNRKTSSIMRQDYNLWSSPVSEQNLLTFSPQTLLNRFYTYNPVTNLYDMVNAPATTNFSTAKGYLIRVANNHPTTPTIWEGQFKGVLNNGDISIPVSNLTYNAVGNPYPSTINANLFITTNNLTEALYFWRKTNNALTTSYATYTLAGGTANAGGSSSIIPNGAIQVGQGFIVKSNATQIKFNNLMRLGNNANQFLRSSEEEIHRFWLNLSYNDQPINQMMVAYMNGATTGIDNSIDGRFINNNPIALNSLIEAEDFVIQGRPLPFDVADIVPLSFKSDVTGNYSIAIDHVDGLFEEGQTIYIKDNLLQLEHNLTESTYNFTSLAGTFKNRFEVIYNRSSLGIADHVSNLNQIVVFTKNQSISINSSKLAIKKIKLFDIRGRLLHEQNEANSNVITIENPELAKQALIIQITTEDNQTTYKKFIY